MCKVSAKVKKLSGFTKKIDLSRLGVLCKIHKKRFVIISNIILLLPI